MNQVQMKSTMRLPIFPILGLIFITLKLTGYITWSWLWVLAPFWIPFIFFLLILALMALIALVSIAKDEERKKNRRR